MYFWEFPLYNVQIVLNEFFKCLCLSNILNVLLIFDIFHYFLCQRGRLIGGKTGNVNFQSCKRPGRYLEEIRQFQTAESNL